MATIIYPPDDDDDDNEGRSDDATQGPRPQRRNVIPLLGPIPNAPPLLPGSELVLDPPTPLQWLALQEAVVVHRNYLRNASSGGSAGEGNVDIDAAPIVAIIDDVTGGGGDGGSTSQRHGRYATLAAIVGISTKSDSRDGERGAPHDEELSFMERLKRIMDREGAGGGWNKRASSSQMGADSIIPMTSSVRLVGVGRASLKEYFYRTPTKERTGGAEDNDVLLGNNNDSDRWDQQQRWYNNSDYSAPSFDWDDADEEAIDYDVDEDSELLDDDAHTPVIMAEFNLLSDDGLSGTGSLDRLGDRGARSANMSPVHALSELHTAANRLCRIHHERRKLVSGLNAAKARLEMAGRMRREGTVEWEPGRDHVSEQVPAPSSVVFYDDFKDFGFDYDGFGLFSGGGSAAAGGEVDEIDDEDEVGGDVGMSVDELLATFPGSDDFELVVAKDVSEVDRRRQKKSDADDLSAMENYGVNHYSYFSNLSDLTEVAMDLFAPYYSPNHREREEHKFEVLSFVAFRALEGYATRADVAWALKCTSSAERMRRAYEIMMDHRLRLTRLAEVKSDELRDCGEECNDLW